MRRAHPNGFQIRFAWVVLCALMILVGCNEEDSNTGEVTVTLSDPPTCKVPFGAFQEVWVTLTLVRAHRSNEGGPDDSGWVDLIDLRDDPKQINLLGSPDATCILTTLGLNEGLPAGEYQQLRLHLLANEVTPDDDMTPSPNACEEAGGFNCVRLANGEMHTLLLSSQANTGLKIPPGQIEGGALRLEGDQPADINIDFDACRSVVAQGNGQYRLKPTLHAAKVVDPTEAISGRVVDNNDTTPIGNAFVLAEQPDADGIDRVSLQTLSDATDGTFNLCPLPGDSYDIVVAAVSDTGMAYNATVTFGVPVGTDMGDIPLIPEDTSPGTIVGDVTTSDGTSTPPEADMVLSALQQAPIDDTTSRLVTVPLFQGSTANVATENNPAACPPQTQCVSYSMQVPASNPMAGIFDAGATMYTEPAMGEVFYTVHAHAFGPGGGGETCTPSSRVTDLDDTGNPLAVTGGMTSTAMTLAFTDCQ